MRTNTQQTIMAALLLAAILTLSCSSDDVGGNGGGRNSSCSINGRTVQIGEQTWMAENLNCNVSGSVCYDNDPSNCNKYGRLYTWEQAMNACPKGWHLPTREEWEALSSYVESDRNCSMCAAKHLKARSSWDSDDGIENLDTYEFSALSGGAGAGVDYFLNAGIDGSWWSSSEYDSSLAYRWRMFCNDDDTRFTESDKSNRIFSVRCLQD